MSIRGSTGVLIIVEATSCCLWFFPCRQKIMHVDLCLFFFSHLQRQGLPVCQVRNDENGALVGNTELCPIIYRVLGIVLESTWGYASNINGAAKALHQTIKLSNGLLERIFSERFLPTNYGALQINTQH